MTQSTRVVGSALAGGLLSLAVFAGASATYSRETPLKPAPGRSIATAALPAAPANGELGFVVSTFSPAAYPGMETNCPAGYAGTVSENFLASLPDPERTRLMRPENEKEFAERWKASALGPNNTNLCSNYDLFPERPTQRTVQGKVAFGIDLDGDDRGQKGKGCTHESFSGPDGSSGIDNQAYRALGCLRLWRGVNDAESDTTVGYRGRLRSGEHTIVLRLRGVDSLVDDNRVEVLIASSLDVPLTDAQAGVVPNASYTLTSNSRWRTLLRGRISNGVLITEPGDVVLRHPNNISDATRIKRDQWEFDDSRLRLAFQPDGSMTGILGGYVPLYSVINRPIQSGLGAVHIVNFDCAAAYNTVRKLADGGRDPKTGQCNTISIAFRLDAVPAYINDALPTLITSSQR